MVKYGSSLLSEAAQWLLLARWGWEGDGPQKGVLSVDKDILDLLVAAGCRVLISLCECTGHTQFPTLSLAHFPI